MSESAPNLTAVLAENPTIFEAHTLSTRPASNNVYFRFNKGEIGISKGLFDLLEAYDCRRVLFVAFKGDLYITRVDRGGFWLNVSQKESRFSSATICHKQFVQQTMRAMGLAYNDELTVPVTRYVTTAAELRIDAQQYPYPFYRLALDPAHKLNRPQ